jgi:hypothetical protein
MSRAASGRDVSKMLSETVGKLTVEANAAPTKTSPAIAMLI